MTRSLLLDEMLTPVIAQQLRRAGLDVIAIAERPDLAGISDDAVLAMATAENRVVVTCNVADFAALHVLWHSASRVHGGVVMLTSAAFPQRRGFIGSVVSALLGSDLPDADQTLYLRPRGDR